VAAAATFAEILESKLDCAHAPRTPGAWNRPLTTPLFFFEQPRAAAFARTHVPAQEKRAKLSAREMQSLTALNALGADLGEDLPMIALRRAFRQLARRYHPDRHPGSSAAELQRLSRLFAEATEHYRVLTAALANHAPH
jgi:hypothetical protein